MGGKMLCQGGKKKEKVKKEGCSAHGEKRG